MSGGSDWYQVRVYSNMLGVGEEETFGDIRDRTHGVSDDVPVGAVHTDGMRGMFEDDDVLVEELGTPLVAWTIVFEEPPLEDYSYYRYPDLREE